MVTTDERHKRYEANTQSFAKTGDSADLDPGIGFTRRRDRLISEILGMFRMSLHDGVISETEAKLMHDWIKMNPDTAFVYPVKQLKERLDRALADGRLVPDEQEDLHLFAARFQPDVEFHHPTPAATKLPLDDPPPPLIGLQTRLSRVSRAHLVAADSGPPSSEKPGIRRSGRQPCGMPYQHTPPGHRRDCSYDPTRATRPHTRYHTRHSRIVTPPRFSKNRERRVCIYWVCRATDESSNMSRTRTVEFGS